ncbi:MAG: amidohydrolase family protein, partial [Hyphomonadaceae bacterium]
GFVGDISALQETYSVRDYRADISDLNVVKSVHVQAEHDEADPVAETRWLQGQADMGGFPHAIVGFADFSRADVEDTLARHAEFANVRGIRQILSHHPDPAYCHAPNEYLKDENWCARIASLKAHNFSFDLQIYPHQVGDALPLIDANPETRFIVNHALEPWNGSEDVRAIWQQGVKALAERSNVSMKISGFAMFLRPFKTATIEPYVLSLIEAFGTGRCMFASNFPVDRLHCTYVEIYSAFSAITSSFSEDERTALFACNAARIYRI